MSFPCFAMRSMADVLSLLGSTQHNIQQTFPTQTERKPWPWTLIASLLGGDMAPQRKPLPNERAVL